jgi:CelD/BcsL family acetyltransferase involved in cellulose biosynthesis
MEAARAAWEPLGERSGNVFATWEWAETWWRHYGRGEQHVAIAREGGEPVAVLPLYLHYRRPVGVARFIGQGPADELGPVCSAGDPRGTEALLRLLRGGRRRFEVLLAERLSGRGWAERLGGTGLQRESSPVIAVEGGGFEDYMATRSRNFRSQLRRKERTLLREHGMRYRLSTAPDRLGRDVEALVALHTARWGRRASGALAGRRAAFHREFAAVALARGWLRLWLAEVDDQPIAAWYGFRFGGAEWYYQLGRDPAWDRYSVGLVLVAHSVREAFDDGVREYKLLRGAEVYKDRFATADPGVETVAVAASPPGRAAVAAGRAGLALRRRLRR